MSSARTSAQCGLHITEELFNPKCFVATSFWAYYPLSPTTVRLLANDEDSFYYAD